jgi:hypothetical protein
MGWLWSDLSAPYMYNGQVPITCEHGNGYSVAINCWKFLTRWGITICSRMSQFHGASDVVLTSIRRVVQLIRSLNLDCCREMTAQCYVASGRPKIFRQTSRLNSVTYSLIAQLRSRLPNWDLGSIYLNLILYVLFKYPDACKHLIQIRHINESPHPHNVTLLKAQTFLSESVKWIYFCVLQCVGVDVI